MSKLTKGFIAILMICCLIITAVPAFAEDAADESIGGFPFKVVDFIGVEEVPFGGNGVDNLYIEDGIFYGTSTGGDPHMPYTPGLDFSADMIDYIIISMFADSDSTSFQFFFTTDTIGWSEDASFRYDFAGDEVDEDGFYTIVLDTATCAAWAGTITGFRVDPFSAEGEFAFKYVTFWSTSPTVFVADFSQYTEAPFTKSGHVDQLFVEDGYLYGSSTAGDPHINFTGDVNFAAANVDTITFRMKAFSANKNFQMFFTTDSIGWSEAASFKVDLTTCEKDAFGWIYVTIDTSTCAEWKGTVTGFRLDPFSAKGVFKFGAISFNAPVVIEPETDIGEPAVKEEEKKASGFNWGVIQYLLNFYSTYNVYDLWF